MIGMMTDWMDHSSGEADFSAGLVARYQRLSLLTLDLAETAGEAVRGVSQPKTGNMQVSPDDPQRAHVDFFDRRMAVMSRAIWMHQVIERLRCGKSVERRRCESARVFATENVSGQGVGGHVSPGFKSVYDPFQDDDTPKNNPSLIRVDAAERPISDDAVCDALMGEGEADLTVLIEALAAEDLECDRMVGDVCDAPYCAPMDDSFPSSQSTCKRVSVKVRHSLADYPSGRWASADAALAPELTSARSGEVPP